MAIRIITLTPPRLYNKWVDGVELPRLPSLYTSFNRRPNKLFRPKRLAISVFPQKG